MRFTTKAMGLVAAIATSAAVAGAQINFAGNTVGAFNGAAFGPAGSTATLGGLTVAAGGFNVNTSPSTGFAGIGGTGNNLGVVSLSGTPFTYSGNTFALRVTFTAPAMTGPTQFSATLLGDVTSTTNGGVAIVFNPNTITNIPFGAPGSAQRGTFTLTADNISVFAGQTNVQITGRLVANVIPEPSTYALMGTGLAGLMGLAARRRRSA